MLRFAFNTFTKKTSAAALVGVGSAYLAAFTTGSQVAQRAQKQGGQFYDPLAGVIRTLPTPSSPGPADTTECNSGDEAQLPEFSKTKP